MKKISVGIIVLLLWCVGDVRAQIGGLFSRGMASGGIGWGARPAASTNWGFTRSSSGFNSGWGARPGSNIATSPFGKSTWGWGAAPRSTPSQLSRTGLPSFRGIRPATTKSANGLANPVRSGGSSRAFWRTTRGNLRKFDFRQSSRMQKGRMGEIASSTAMRRAGYRQMPSKLPRNNGFDGVFVRKTPNGPRYVIAESKFNRAGSLRLTQTKAMGRQMDRKWVTTNIRKMTQSTNPKVQATGRSLRNAYINNPSSIQYKAGVLKSNGFMKWTTVR